MVERYTGYKAELLFRDIWIDYMNRFDNIRQSMYDQEVNVDGVDNIFVLLPAQYWSEELCQRALGCSASEVIRRLTKAGALMVMPMLDGIYCVLNDNSKIELEEYIEMNHKFKRALGINDGAVPRKKILGLL